MRKFLLCVSCFVLCSLSVVAIPARNGVHRLEDRNGNIIEAELVGDEYGHCFKTADGYIVKETADGFYEKSDVRFDAAELDIRRQKLKRAKAVENDRRTFASSHAQKGLVILVSFSDVAFSKTKSSFYNMLNQYGYSDNGATGSAKDYFSAMSYATYSPTFDVYGPYTLPKNQMYYGQDIGGSEGNDAHPDQMIVDAVAKLVADKGSSVLSQYDCDGDGYVDNVFVFYAGFAQSEGASSNTIWPHRWKVFSRNVDGQITYNGVTISDYACSSELLYTSGSTMTAVGSFCHEFSHVLGLVDLYDTGGSYSFNTPNSWDLMDMGCYNNDMRTPAAYSAYERFVVGWMQPVVITGTGHFELNDVNSSTQCAYLISPNGWHNMDGANPNPAEFYMLENRQKSGWDAALPGSGMLVWKIKYNAANWAGNTVNANKNNQGVDLIEAGGDVKEDGYYVSSSSDAYPGSKKVTSCTTYPRYNVVNIVEKGGKISFDIQGKDADVACVQDEVKVIRLRDGGCIVSGLEEGQTVMVFDAVGKLIFERQAEGETMTFRYDNGVFFVKVR